MPSPVPPPDGFDDRPDPAVAAPRLDEPTGEEYAQATDGSIAARLRAVGKALRQERRHDFAFAVNEDTMPGVYIVMTARQIDGKIKDRIGMEAFIVQATAQLKLRDGDGDTPLPFSWGKDLADALDIPVSNTGELVRYVVGGQAGCVTFVQDLLEWMGRRAQEAEMEMGE